MGRPEADSSTYQTEQPQECDIQPQEYQYEPTLDANTPSQDNISTVNIEIQYQPQFTDTSANHPPLQQQQQDYQPQQRQDYQPLQQQAAAVHQQAQRYTPEQANQDYGAQPAQPTQFPPQGLQNNPMNPSGLSQPQHAGCPPQGPQMIQTRPAQIPFHHPIQLTGYPPQGPQTNPLQPTAYPPQGSETTPTQPVQFPPLSRQTNPMYPSGPNQAAAYPAQGLQKMQVQPSSGTYPLQVTSQVFPSQALGFAQIAYQAPQPQAASFPSQNAAQGHKMPPSPYKPPPQANTAAQGIPVMMYEANNDEGWRTGLFDCMNDPTNAVITACFPCVTFGQIAEIIDNGQTTCATSGMIYGCIAAFIGIPCILSCGYRSKLRAKFGLVESPAPDLVTHFLCEWCALCQEYRELQLRGLDPAIGWEGNLAKQSMQQPQVAMVPPTNQRMMA